MISSHVLDTAAGIAAVGVRITLEVSAGDAWRSCGAATTDSDGRARELLTAGVALERAQYRLRFDTGAYFGGRAIATFYPSVVVEFSVTDPAQHHHVPLLISPFGYSTYRGS